MNADWPQPELRIRFRSREPSGSDREPACARSTCAHPSSWHEVYGARTCLVGHLRAASIDRVDAWCECAQYLDPSNEPLSEGGWHALAILQHQRWKARWRFWKRWGTRAEHRLLAELQRRGKL